MKKAIAYARISTKDQSNFSLTGQDEYIKDYCRKQSIELLAVFTDDGFSAKNFDRPDWKELEDFVKRNYANVDELLVCKYDRFSRNLAEALRMIELLENRYHIRVISIFEPIGMHPKSPYYFKVRADILTGAQTERLMIIDRTKFGIRNATAAGRYINMAPFGYINARDDNNKPIIKIDETRAGLIREIYKRFLLGENIQSIRIYAKENGYTVQGKSNIQRLLSSPTYGGLIKVPAFYDEPEKLVKGIHQPIISETEWWKVQAILNSKKTIQRTVLNDDVPLRGTLRCFCGHQLTAGNSKGKNNYVWYYKCNSHTKINIPAKFIHQQLDEMLKELNLPAIYIEYLQKKIKEELHIATAEQEKKASQMANNLVELCRKLDNLEDKFISQQLDTATFKKWQIRYRQEQSQIETNLAELRRPLTDVYQTMNQQLCALGRLDFYYHKATTVQKQSLTKWLFNSQLYYQDKVYRTPFIQPLFAGKAATLAEKGLLIVEQPLEKNLKIEECTPAQPSVEHLREVLIILAAIKVA